MKINNLKMSVQLQSRSHVEDCDGGSDEVDLQVVEDARQTFQLGVQEEGRQEEKKSAAKTGRTSDKVAAD